MDAPRFNAVAKTLAAHAPRRTLLKLLPALGLGGAGMLRAAALTRAAVSSGGIAGAGLVAVGDGAYLALFATRPADSPPDEDVTGHLWWEEPAWQGTGLTLSSTRIEAYGPLAGEEEQGREVRGLARVNDQDDVPFRLQAIAGAAAGGEDRVRLWVGDAIPAGGSPVAGFAGFGYAAEGALVAGSLTLLRFDEPEEGAGTPVP